MVVIRLFTIVPARVSTMFPSRTERPVTVIGVSFKKYSNASFKRPILLSSF